jgi:AAA+ ATPase superfamily predicted ATPase
MVNNPFLISGYISPEYFCDRENETVMVVEAIRNRRHLTIFSPRRIGKTGLIKHVFHTGKRMKYFIPVYTDILATSTLRDFTENFGRAVLSSLASNEPAIKRILKRLAAIRPKAGIDPITGEPYISLTVSNEKEAVYSLEVIFGYLQGRKEHFVLAIDEFQQVVNYPEKNVEAFLRTHVQQTSNISMVFSGSRKHILTGIFYSPDRPFYNSTQLMELGKIESEKYKNFIAGKFERNGINTESSSIDLILEVTSSHTFYVQFLCNRLFSNQKKIGSGEVHKMLLEIVTENEAVYASYITMLTPLQFRILRAIAVNGGVKNPTSSEFLSSYDLGAASSVSLAVKSLQDKEFIDLDDNVIRLNDMFLNFWLKYKAGVI